MMRRTALRLAAAAPKKELDATKRPGEVQVGVSDWIQTFVNPLYHFQRFSDIEEEIDATKQRKWLIMAIVLSYPAYYILYGMWEAIRLPSANKETGYPPVQWNDESAGKA
ncbi:hypothetical protein DIPPA_05857 [Diplonema papillatum]|nr:hypothetical protein DIPPA_05857 [Diplonema papillatum]